MKNKYYGWRLIASITIISMLILFFHPAMKVQAKETILYNTSNDTNAKHILILCIMLTLVCFAAMVLILRMKTKSEKKVAEAALELNQITNSIHAGFVNFTLDGSYNIVYASKGYYDIIGYSKEEVQEDYENSLIPFIIQEDYEKFHTLRSVYCLGEYIQIEIRMQTKNNKTIWVLINGNYMLDKSGKGIISAVFVDITESKLMHEQLLLEEERYRIAAEISNDILFEYDIENDIMKLADKYMDLYGRDPIIIGFSKLYLRKDCYIHLEDIGVFVEYCRSLKSGKEMVESEFRICDVTHEYIWCHTRGKTIYNDAKKPIRVLGKLVNIDIHKKELEKLENKAKRDPLTGVYNKLTTKELIDHFILNHEDGKHIFMIVDIDDFKQINDHYGHIQGDKVLTFVIDQVRTIFSSGEIIGRIGGDEFAIFIGDIGNVDIITMKAKSLQRALRTVYIEKDYEISLSGSIGIAIYPEDGHTYNQLLSCADKALYYVKKQGKNGYRLFT